VVGFFQVIINILRVNGVLALRHVEQLVTEHTELTTSRNISCSLLAISMISGPNLRAAESPPV
jgi:hypothetical protein